MNTPLRPSFSILLCGVALFCLPRSAPSIPKLPTIRAKQSNDPLDDPIKIVNGQVWPSLNPESAKAVLKTSIDYVEGDPLIVAPTNEHEGMLAYTFPVYKSQTLSNFIVIYDTLHKNKVIYPVSVKENRVMQPHFSPDGSALLVMVGTYDSQWPRFRLYVLNLHTRQWKKIPSAEINFPHIEWSPDSRSIAFVEGGNVYGEELEGGEPLRLMVCRWEEGETHVVAQNKGVVGGFCFASPESLLYSQLPPDKSEKKQDHLLLAPQPSIFEAKVTEASHLLLRFAHRPSISPDGKHLAFFGAENVQRPSALTREWWINPQGSSLCVANRNGSGRRALNLQRDIYSPVLWPYKREYVWSLERTQPSPNARFTLKEWNLQSGFWHSRGDLRLEDSEAVDSYNDIDPQVRVSGQPEKDNSFFFAQVQVKGLLTHGKRDVVRSIQRFDASTGKTTLVAQVSNQVGDIEGVGIDWHPITIGNKR